MTTRPVSFDRIARLYRWMEYVTFLRTFERCRFASLPATEAARHALVYGDGDGRFLAQMLRRNRTMTADAIDSSRAMLRLAEKRVRAVQTSNEVKGRVRFHHADALAFAPLATYDLVATHFFLDCFRETEIERLLNGVEGHLAAHARWIVSEFAIPPSRPGAWFARLIIGALYRGFGLLTGLRVRTLPRYAPLLRRHGFKLRAEQSFVAGLLRSEVWERDF